jgi:DNA adenine methylase
MQEASQPILKWVGGKRTLLPEILPRISISGAKGRYIEPFVGGGAVFFGIAHVGAIISDLNSSLIHFYKSVRDDDILFSRINSDAKNYSKLDIGAQEEFFYKVRKRFNARKMDTRHAADFYLLNKLGFNGLYRENSSGEYNTPFGHRKTLPTPDVSNWGNAKRILKKTQIKNQSFEITCLKAEKGDFVYLDPPYIPLTPTAAFTTYSADGFGLDKQKLLAEVCKDLTKRKVLFLLSNSDTNLTKEIFSDFTFTEISAQRLVSAKAIGRKPVGELLISNFKQR